MGLELKPSKTRITHTLNETGNEKPGFNFLGFNIRQYKVGKYTSGKSNGKLLGFKTIITPAKQSQKKHYSQIADLIERHKGATQAALISRLNPVIRGWCNYYKTVASQRVFQKLDHLTYYKLRKWGKYRHSNKGNKWIVNKYWQTIGGDNWVFATRQEGKTPRRLQKHSEVKIQRHVKVKSEVSPYDGNLVYWSVRMGKHPEMPKRTALLLKKQEGRCSYCGLFLRDGDARELDHIIPKSKGGRDEYKNWQLLHRHCHDEKTRDDRGSDKKSYVKPVKRPEDYRWENDILVTY
jgi:RNA-directed DNA polymerase